MKMTRHALTFPLAAGLAFSSDDPCPVCSGSERAD